MNTKGQVNSQRVSAIELMDVLIAQLNRHVYAYDWVNRRTNQTFLAGNSTAYTYDNLGQAKTPKGKESGGTIRGHEQYGYVYDTAHNLQWGTNLSWCRISSWTGSTSAPV